MTVLIPVIPSPTLNSMSPALPFVAAPVSNNIVPLVPELVVPDLNIKFPLVPNVPAFRVWNTIDPLDFGTLLPPVRLTAPPLWCVLWPDKRLTLPSTTPFRESSRERRTDLSRPANGRRKEARLRTPRNLVGSGTKMAKLLVLRRRKESSRQGTDLPSLEYPPR